EFVPTAPGLIVADRYGGAIVRPSPVAAIHAGRRKAVTLRFARVAAERLAAMLEEAHMPMAIE
ncbi:MAG TPA: MmcB family DNA repair protein, partial [Rhizomicrobium sp.]|nr:MmcB family DNA repair protein [Rhizomicrobium sp.]